MSSDGQATALVIERSDALEARSTRGTPPFDTAAAVLEPEPSWLPPPDITRIDWEAFGDYPHHLAAHIFAGLLDSEGVPTIVMAWTAFPGVASATLWVPKHLMHRARWIAALAPPSDTELLFLATGGLS
jgi:hypothetical protein